MSFAVPPRVFISYARRDGEAFATALRRRLETEQPEIPVWHDRGQMEGGVGWWKQIEEALDKVKFLVIVMSPAAMTSEITRREWRYARQKGVVVYPVKGAADGALDYASLPTWMRKAHFFELEQEWDTFTNYLKSDRQPVRVPFMAPDLPKPFVPRPREFESVLGLLLDRTHQNPVAITTALHGAGGYGKTTLATALCHDDRVIDAFDDGILWVTLGQTPNVLGELAKTYEALTGEQGGFVDVDQGARKLAERLEHSNCLIVIDDVWDDAHAAAFLRGRDRCARVITTRRLDVESGCARVTVDEMTSAESVAVLATAFHEGTAPTALLQPLARRLGEWPLLLHLAAGMLRKRLARGDTAERAVAYISKALDKRGVTAFDSGQTSERDKAVALTVAASRDLLAPEDRRRLVELAIFPEEAQVPLTTVGALWGLDALDTEECAQRLDDVALVTLDLRDGTLTLHDVMRTLLLRELDDLPRLHAALTAGYRDLLCLPDSYAWRWLPYHLARAGEHERLRALLLNPEWLQAQGHHVGPYAQLKAFEEIRRDTDLELVRGALRLAVPALAVDPSQFCEQMLGRLPTDVSVDLARFGARLEEIAPVPRLRARWPNLQGPGSLVQTWPHEAAVGGALLLPDGRVLSWSHDGTLRVWDVTTGEGRALTGHQSLVGGALLLPDERVLSWSADGTLRVWDVTTGEGNALTGHQGSVRGALLLSDGRVLSWGADGTLRVWDVTTGEGRALTGHQDWVDGALLLPDGRVLSWSADGTLRVWDVATGEGRTLTGHQGWVGGALLLPDERVLSWGADGTLRVWDVTTAKGRTLTGHQGWVGGALLLPDGRVLSWSADGTLRVWDATTGEGRALTGHQGSVGGALLLPGERMLSWGADGTLRVWDVTTGDGRTLTGHQGWVGGTLLLPDERVLSWGADGTLRVWDVTTGDGRALAGHQGWVGGALLLADGPVLSWSADGTLRVWDVTTGEGRALTGHQGPAGGALLLPDERVVSWSADGTLRVWDVTTGEGRALTGHQGSVSGALLLPDRRVLSWSHDGTLRVWDVTTAEGFALTGHQGLVGGALLLPDGRVLSWSADGTLRMWDVTTGEGRALTGHQGLVGGALLLPDGQVLSWSADGTLRVWDVTTGEARALTGHQGSVSGALLMPDERVLSWSADGTLRVWDVTTGEGRALTGHQGWVGGALLLPDERVLSWGDDGTLRVWNVATGEGRALTGHQGWVGGALLLPDGRVLSWGDDGTLRVWDVPTGENIALTGHESWVDGALLLPDGRLLSWGRDRCLRRQLASHKDTGEAFYFDGAITSAVVTGPDQFFVGDVHGHVHFLELVVTRSRLPHHVH